MRIHLDSDKLYVISTIFSYEPYDFLYFMRVYDAKDGRFEREISITRDIQHAKPIIHKGHLFVPRDRVIDVCDINDGKKKYEIYCRGSTWYTFPNQITAIAFTGDDKLIVNLGLSISMYTPSPVDVGCYNLYVPLINKREYPQDARDMVVYKDEIYILLDANQGIRVYNLSGFRIREYQFVPHDKDEDLAWSLAVSSFGMAIAFPHSKYILIYNLDGTFQRQIGSKADEAFNLCSNVAFSDSGELFVSSDSTLLEMTFGDCVQVFR